MSDDLMIHRFAGEAPLAWHVFTRRRPRPIRNFAGVHVYPDRYQVPRDVKPYANRPGHFYLLGRFRTKELARIFVGLLRNDRRYSGAR